MQQGQRRVVFLIRLPEREGERGGNCTKQSGEIDDVQQTIVGVLPLNDSRGSRGITTVHQYTGEREETSVLNVPEAVVHFATCNRTERCIF